MRIRNLVTTHSKTQPICSSVSDRRLAAGTSALVALYQSSVVLYPGACCQAHRLFWHASSRLYLSNPFWGRFFRSTTVGAPQACRRTTAKTILCHPFCQCPSSLSSVATLVKPHIRKAPAMVVSGSMHRQYQHTSSISMLTRARDSQ